MGKNLITGGFGFIGYHLAKLLLDEGEEVVVFDVASESRLAQGIKNSVTIVRGDLSNWVHVLDAVKDNDISCIYHAGALLPPITEQSPAAAYAVNVTGSFNILEAARLLGVDSVIYPSTLATFGLDVPRIVPNDASQRPPNMYGVTKVCSERLGEYYHTRFGVNFRGVRFPPILGMGRFDRAQSAYNYLAIQESALGRPYTVYVDKSTTIALLYVKDAVQGLVDLKKAEDGKLTRRVYNLYGFSITAQDLVDSVRRYIPEAQIDFKPDQAMIRLVKNLPERLDDTLAREDWGWCPRYSLDQAVENFIGEVRANRAIYE
jgi:nucleoside-diphosphate-sugar epimerase